MRYGVVYIVIREGEVVYASTDFESAEAYADTQGYAARERVLEEWGNDDPSEKDLREAEWQAGFDGDYFEVESIDISNLTPDDVITLQDGSTIDVSDILSKLDHDDSDDEF